MMHGTSGNIRVDTFFALTADECLSFSVINFANPAILAVVGKFFVYLNFNLVTKFPTTGWEIPFTVMMPSLLLLLTVVCLLYFFKAVATAVVAVISQFFLGYRILRLTKSWPIFILVAVLSVVGGVGGIVAGIRSGIIWE
jgi:hypothetical protein